MQKKINSEKQKDKINIHSLLWLNAHIHTPIYVSGKFDFAYSPSIAIDNCNYELDMRHHQFE